MGITVNWFKKTRNGVQSLSCVPSAVAEGAALGRKEALKMVTSGPTECLEGWYTDASPRTAPLAPANKEECMQQILKDFPMKKAAEYTRGAMVGDVWQPQIHQTSDDDRLYPGCNIRISNLDPHWNTRTVPLNLATDTLDKDFTSIGDPLSLTTGANLLQHAQRVTEPFQPTPIIQHMGGSFRSYIGSAPSSKSTSSTGSILNATEGGSVEFAFAALTDTKVSFEFSFLATATRDSFWISVDDDTPVAVTIPHNRAQYV